MNSFLKSKAFKQTVGFAVSAAIIIWMVASLEWQKVFVALRSASLLPLIPAFAILVCHYVLRSFRWRYLLPAIQNRPKVRSLFDAMMAGNFTTYILPLRAGEFIRPLLLSRTSDYPFPTAFVSVVIERFFDLTTVLLSFAILLNFLPHLDPLVYKGAGILGCLAAVIFAVLMTGIFAPKVLQALTGKIGAIIPSKAAALEKFCSELLHGLSVLHDPANLLKVIGLSLVVWGSCYLMFFTFLFCFNLPASFLVGATVAVILSLAVAAPSAPGFIGIYQAGCILSLKIFGVSEEVAAAYGILTHIFQYLLTIGYGLYLLSRHNLRLRDLKTRA